MADSSARMNSPPNNPQIALWRGQFGADYIARNSDEKAQIPSLRERWSEILRHTVSAPPCTILEIGPNIGLNLRALRFVTHARFYGVEPNDLARQTLLRDRILDAADLRAGAASLIDFPDGIADLAFTSGVLMHIHPDDLLLSCREIHRCAKHWIACIEYFADQPEGIPYRGHQDMLFKRDFGSFWLDNFPDLSVAGYGFFWKRVTGLDNCNWWLFWKS